MTFGESLQALAADGTAVIGFVAAAAIVLLLTPLVGRLAPRIGGLDDKADRPRVHQGAIPRIGGLAIIAGILLPGAVLIELDGPYLGIFVGTLLVAALGLVDDLRGVSPSRKLVGVMVIALVPVIGFDVTFDRVTLPGIGDHDIGVAAYPLTILWVVLLANLVNLIDGMDSLAAGIVAIAAGSFAILSASFGRADAAVLSAIVCGSTLAFLFHNYHPAKIFMGDSVRSRSASCWPPCPSTAS
jgi:UDP-GlcNAc:undecaprenyl-phosphate GlcNAc-1-phosphate transferase